MKLITWNIQWGLGMDGRVDLRRIVDTARDMADFDVLCLQEVTDNYPALSGNDGADQFAALRALLPGYAGIEGVAVERYDGAGRRQRFGNMIFTRLPVVQVFRHQLPWPGEAADVPTMPRMALEAVLEPGDGGGALRVTTTHLEFYSARQRAAQLERLRAINLEAHEQRLARPQPHKIGSPFATTARGGRAVLTGDFNCTPDEPALAALQRPLDGEPAYVDGWRALGRAGPHPPTVNLDPADAAQRPRCLDYIFVNPIMAAEVRAFAVNENTRASDHQPIILETEAS